MSGYEILSLLVLGVLLVFASSACNPWVYAERMRHFRNAMRNIMSPFMKCRLPTGSLKTSR